MPKALFETGRLLATRGIVDSGIDTLAILKRHVLGDWGDLDEDDKRANQTALLTGERLLSAYHVDGKKIYIITEADRSATTVLFAEEY